MPFGFNKQLRMNQPIHAIIFSENCPGHCVVSNFVSHSRETWPGPHQFAVISATKSLLTCPILSHTCSVVGSCVSPDKGPGYSQDSAYEPRGMSDDQRLQVLPQSAITTQTTKAIQSG